MIYKRFSEKTAEEWRQIYKALQLLEYLVKNGAERVIDDARQHVGTLKLLRNFHYIDEKMKDQGINVRNRAKELVDLLQSSDRIREERRKAKSDQKKFGGGVSAVSSDGQFASGGGFGNTGKKYGGFSSDDYGSGAAGQVYGDGGGFTAPAPSSSSSRRVYGDGGGTSGTTSPGPGASAARAAERRDRAQRNRAAAGFAEGALGSVQAPLERFDDYDEGEWGSGSGSAGPSRTTYSSQRTTVPKPIPSKDTAASKPKPKEVDLFSFDDEPAPAAAPRQPASIQTNFASKAPAPPVVPSGGDDDDDFDDFQSASTNMAAPAPIKQASLMNVMGPASPAKAQQAGAFDLFTSSGSGSGLAPPPAFGSVAPQQQQQQATQQPQRSTNVATGPNYYASGLFTTQTNAQNKLEATSSPFGGATRPAGSATAASVAGGAKKAGGADAFGDLLSGFKSSNVGANNNGASGARQKQSLASLNQTKASQGIWGATTTTTATPAAVSGKMTQADDDDFGDFSGSNTNANANGKTAGGGGGSSDLLF